MRNYGHLKKFYSRYGRQGGVGVFTLPQTSSIIIETPFNGALTSSTGPTPTFARNLIRNYANSKTTLAQVATQTPVFGSTVFGATNSLASGIEIVGETENLCLRSEEFTDAVWTAVGTGTASANTATDPFGTTLADTIAGSATGDGIENITSLSSVNGGFPAPTTAVLFSVFLKCSTGTQLVHIGIRDSAGVTLQKLEPCRLSTTWRRFEIYQNFNASAAGTVVVQIIVGNSNTCRAFGAQLQRAGNTGGSNMRARAFAGPYVKTDGSTRFCNTETLTYPAATVDNARAEGSVSFWVKPGRDYTGINEGNIVAYFSLSGESFAFYDSSAAATFWIGNGIYKNFGMGLRTGVWNHVVLTWKDSSNERSIIVNGQVYMDVTTAFTTWTAGSDLYLGCHSGTAQYWSSFATFRNFVMWTRKLTNAEALQIYNGQVTSTFNETYASGLLFEADLGVSIAPTTANDYNVQYDGTLVPTSFNHTGTVATVPYYSDATTYAGFAAYNMPALPASPPLNTATNKGMVFTPNNKNFILRSCEPATTWTLVGTATAVDGVGNAFGANMPYGTIAGVAGDGIKQSISLATADNSFVVGAWVRVAAGTLAGKIHIEGSSGGTPQTSTTSFTATTTWQLVSAYQPFTGAATGNAQMRLELDAAGTLQVSGMTLERRLGGQFANACFPYTFIKTTSAAVEVLPQNLWYRTAGNINPKSGTAIGWAWLDMDSVDIINSDGPNLFSIVGDHGQWVFDLHYVGDNLSFSFGGNSSNLATILAPVGILKNVWYQYGVSWSMDDTGTGDIRLYIDGVLRDTQLITGGLLPGWSRLVVGSGILAQLATDDWKGGIGQIRIYGDQSDAYVSADWTANRVGYGR
jgi:hypothetical protein